MNIFPRVIVNVFFSLSVSGSGSAFPQYIEYPNTQITYSDTGTKVTFDDGTTQVRKRMVVGIPNILYTDITKTPTGFAGAEDTDWEWLEKINLPNQGSLLAIFRDGVRTNTFKRDTVLDNTGFAGVEDISWEQIASYVGGGIQTTFRDGVRNVAYVIDKELTATGFAGTIDVDWENILTRKII